MTDACTSYRENDIRAASPVRLVILLYDQLIQDLNQASQAIEQNEIERRTRHINHAILVIGHMQSPLDFTNGGKVAGDLDRFYSALRQTLVEVQFFPSKAGVQRVLTDVLAVREAWIEVERAETRLSASAAAPAFSTSSEPQLTHMDWKG